MFITVENREAITDRPGEYVVEISHLSVSKLGFESELVLRVVGKRVPEEKE